jgi:folate-binding protein YgfZ
VQRTSLTDDRLERLRSGALGVQTEPAVFEITGSGALTCLQGLLTNDLVHPGEWSLVYGALLTPKGAVVVDYWVLRLPDRFLLVAEPTGHAASVDLFRRSLPPRLARTEDRTGSIVALWLYGGGVAATLGIAGLPALPAAGRVAAAEALLLARPQTGAPFQAVLIGPAAQVEQAGAQLIAAGATAGEAADRDAARILAGWPLLGAEIGERTLVQEVRYDEIGGVSYTKGCYTGQETVARLHFRGHTNREMRGLVWSDAPPSTGEAVTDAEGKDLGVVTSLLMLPGRTLGLGFVRREVEPGSEVTAAGQKATVVSLPFDSPWTAVA